MVAWSLMNILASYLPYEVGYLWFNTTWATYFKAVGLHWGPISFNPFRLFVLTLFSWLWHQPSSSYCYSRLRHRHSCWRLPCSSIPPANSTALPGPPSPPPPPHPWRRSPCLSPYRSHRWVSDSHRWGGKGGIEWQSFFGIKSTFWLLVWALKGLRSSTSARWVMKPSLLLN